MAASYDYLPINIPAVFKSLVATVSENLSDETSVAIPFVSCKVETWTELCARLKAESDSPLHKETKYPLVALIRNFDEKIKSDSPFVEASLTVVIVTRTDPAWLSETREATNYTPVLYPIYAELMSVIADSDYFVQNNNPYPSHTKQDSLHLGANGTYGNTAYLLPDPVDGIVITNLQLVFDIEKCLTASPGPTQQLMYVNNVSQLSCVTGTRTLRVTLDVMNYVDVADVGTPIFSIYTSHNDTSTGGAIEGFANQIVFNGNESGEYYGYIQCADGITISKLYFYYTLRDGEVVKYSTLSKFNLTNFTLTGFEYLEYPFDVITHMVCNKAVFSQIQLTYDSGNVLETIDFTPVTADTTATTTNLALKAPSTYRDIGCNILIEGSVDGATLLESISYYKLN